MTKLDKTDVFSEYCLIAAEQIQIKLMAISRKIRKTKDLQARPSNPLLIDVLIDELKLEIRSPLSEFTPMQKKEVAWSRNSTAYLYAGIEHAFVKSGRLPGGNRSGYVKKLRKLRSWALKQIAKPDRPVPLGFVVRTNLLFACGILDERRNERALVILRLASEERSSESDLRQLLTWIDADLCDPRIFKKGRSPDSQKIVFAVEIANLWHEMTGKVIAKAPNSRFVRFVSACWSSGFSEFTGLDVNANFVRIISSHVFEMAGPFKCGKCASCEKLEICDRKCHYVGLT